jgi:hypothetical protein
MDGETTHHPSFVPPSLLMTIRCSGFNTEELRIALGREVQGGEARFAQQFAQK